MSDRRSAQLTCSSSLASPQAPAECPLDGTQHSLPTACQHWRLYLVLRSAVVVSGIPQPTVCPVTVAAGALPNFVATCYTGNPSSPKNTDLYSYNSDDTPAPGQVGCWVSCIAGRACYRRAAPPVCVWLAAGTRMTCCLADSSALLPLVQAPHHCVHRLHHCRFGDSVHRGTHLGRHLLWVQLYYLPTGQLHPGAHLPQQPAPQPARGRLHGRS